ncbi:hypothetical protein [Algiphilus sp.]|uniref:hypothetical protein n=1 Tax=Algiphilus sp. TaxID=1872431 RepID=UPI003C41569F
MLIALACLAFIRNIVLVNVQDAFVNAYLSTVRSPIPGEVRTTLPAPGTRVAKDHVVAIRNARPDDTILIETSERLARVSAELGAARSQFESLSGSRAEFAQWGERFREARARYLADRRDQIASRLAAQREEAENARRELRRLENLDLYVPERQLDAARTRMEISTRQARALEAESAQLETERKALADQIQIADTFSERTYSDQQVQETALRMSLLTAEIDSLGRQQASLREAVDAARDQVARERAAEVRVADAVVWQRVPTGTHVPRGGELGAIAPCADVVVTATLDRRAFQRIQVGDTATVRMRTEGGDSVEAGARVITLTGAAMENVLGMAIPFGRATLEDAYGAVLRLDAPETLDCAIGHPVRVRFGDGGRA